MTTRERKRNADKAFYDLFDVDQNHLRQLHGGLDYDKMYNALLQCDMTMNHEEYNERVQLLGEALEHDIALALRFKKIKHFHQLCSLRNDFHKVEERIKSMHWL